MVRCNVKTIYYKSRIPPTSSTLTREYPSRLHNLHVSKKLLISPPGVATRPRVRSPASTWKHAKPDITRHTGGAPTPQPGLPLSYSVNLSSILKYSMGSPKPANRHQGYIKCSADARNLRKADPKPASTNETAVHKSKTSSNQ